MVNSYLTCPSCWTTAARSTTLSHSSRRYQTRASGYSTSAASVVIAIHVSLQRLVRHMTQLNSNDRIRAENYLAMFKGGKSVAMTMWFVNNKRAVLTFLFLQGQFFRSTFIYFCIAIFSHSHQRHNSHRISALKSLCDQLIISCYCVSLITLLKTVRGHSGYPSQPVLGQRG